MALTRKNFLQRTADGKYLRDNGTWGTGISGDGVYFASNRGNIGAVADAKPEVFQRITKQYTKS